MLIIKRESGSEKWPSKTTRGAASTPVSADSTPGMCSAATEPQTGRQGKRIVETSDPFGIGVLASHMMVLCGFIRGENRPKERVIASAVERGYHEAPPRLARHDRPGSGPLPTAR
jgi:hypothetical protein